MEAAVAGWGPKRTMLLRAAAALAVVTGLLHLYFAFAFFGGDDPLRIVFVGIGAIFMAGAAAAALDFKRDLAVKAGAAWTVLTILTWAGGAAGGRSANLQPLSFVDKAVEVALLVLLFPLLRDQGRPSDPAALP